MQQIKKSIILAIYTTLIVGCNNSPTAQEKSSNNEIKTISMETQTKHYNIGRKESKNELFKEDITFNASDKYISIENSKWVLPLTLKVKNNQKVIWQSQLKGNDEIKFKIPTNILKHGYRIEIKSFTGVVMDSKVK